MFQTALLVGGTYSIWPQILKDKKMEEIFYRYIPLIQKLNGRRWLLEPNPLSLPFGIEGNIFIGKNGNILIPLITRWKSALEKNHFTTELTVTINIRHASKIRRVKSIGADYPGERKVFIQHKGKSLKLTIPEHGATSLLILEREDSNA